MTETFFFLEQLGQEVKNWSWETFENQGLAVLVLTNLCITSCNLQNHFTRTILLNSLMSILEHLIIEGKYVLSHVLAFVCWHKCFLWKRTICVPLGRNLQGLSTVSVRTISQADMKVHLPTIGMVLTQRVKVRVENFWHHKNGVKYELLKRMVTNAIESLQANKEEKTNSYHTPKSVSFISWNY